MLINIKCQLLYIIVIWYCVLFHAVTYASEEPQYHTSSSSKKLDKIQKFREDKLGAFSVLPDELIQFEVIKRFDQEDDKASLDCLMCVSKAFQGLVLGYYEKENDKNAYSPWQNCEALNARNLYYTYRYMAMLVGMHINMDSGPKYKRTYDPTDMLRFNKLCSKFLISSQWSQDTILWAYPKMLSLSFEDPSSESFRQVETQVFDLLDTATSNTEDLLKREYKVPAEWLLQFHIAHIRNGRFWGGLTLSSWKLPISFVEAFEVLTRVQGPLFAPYNLRLLSLKEELLKRRENREKESPTLLESIVLLEPMPTVVQLQMVANIYRKIGNYSKSADFEVRKLDACIAAGATIAVEDYLEAAEEYVKGNNHLQAANIYHKAIGLLQRSNAEPHLFPGEAQRLIFLYGRADECYSKAGVVCLEAIYYAEAASLFRKEIATGILTDGKYRGNYLEIAEKFYKLKNYLQASLFYLKGIDLWYGLDEGLYNRVCDSVSKAIESCIQDERYAELAEFYKAQNKAAAAKFQTISPDQYKRTGDAYFQAKKYKKAGFFYGREIDAANEKGEEPVDISRYKRAGDAYFLGKEYNKAKTFYLRKVKVLKKAGLQPEADDYLDVAKACENSWNSSSKKEAQTYIELANETRQEPKRKTPIE